MSCMNLLTRSTILCAVTGPREGDHGTGAGKPLSLIVCLSLAMLPLTVPLALTLALSLVLSSASANPSPRPIISAVQLPFELPRYQIHRPVQ